MSQHTPAITPEDKERKRHAVQLEMAQLERRAAELGTRRTRIQVQLETARKQYTEAVTEAIAHHQTSNLAELREKLADLEAENVRIVESFKAALDDFEAFVVRMEEALADPEAMAALLTSMDFSVKVVLAAPAAVAAPAQVPAFEAEDI